MRLGVLRDDTDIGARAYARGAAKGRASGCAGNGGNIRGRHVHDLCRIRSAIDGVDLGAVIDVRVRALIEHVDHSGPGNSIGPPTRGADSDGEQLFARCRGD